MRQLLLLATLVSLVLFPLNDEHLSAFAAAPPEPTPPAPIDGTQLVEAIEAMSQRLELLEQTAAAQATSGQPPMWSVEAFAEIDRRLERLTRFQERTLSALEEPAPRLSEPMVLLSVGLCMLVLGFIAGRVLGGRRVRDRRGRL